MKNKDTRNIKDVINRIEKDLKPSINKETIMFIDESEINSTSNIPSLIDNLPGLDHPDADKDWGHGVTVSQLATNCKDAMSTMPEIILKYSNIYKVNPALVTAIAAHESGWGSSSAIRNKNNPMGVMDRDTQWKYVKHFPSLQEGFRYSISNLSRNYIAQGIRTIEQMAKKYAPVGAHNDGKGYNKNWPPGVNKIFTEITGKKYTPDMSGPGVADEKLTPVVGGVNGGVTGDGSGEGPSINFDNREPDDLLEVKGVILCFNFPHHLYKAKEYQDKWREVEKHYGYNRRFHFVTDDTGLKAAGDDRKILESMVDNNTSTYINRALFKNKAINNCVAIGAFVDLNKDYKETEARLIRDCARVLHKYGLETKDLWREFDLNRAPSHLIYLERISWKKFLQQVDKQLIEMYEQYPVQKKVNYESNVGKELEVLKDCDILKLPEDKADIVEAIKKGQKVKIRKYSNTWYEIEKPRGWLQVKHIKHSLDKTRSNKEVVLEQVGTNATIKMPNINESKLSKVEIITEQEEFEMLLNFGDNTVIENYAQMHEPYDKGLEEIIDAKITNDERLESLTVSVMSKNENEMYYSVIDASPGPGDHCKRAPGELNAIWKSENLRVEPIYPDLIIPPNFATTDQNIHDPNALPPGIFTDKSAIDNIVDNYTKEEIENMKIKMFDYSKVKKEKTTTGKPINYKDPFPYDDKIHELEAHSPKVKIDEIESRLYDCNHIGCPIGQPMAKNFHMLNDAMIAQSKKTEARLVKLENVMSTMLRNLGRLGSRININCVYYGGQDTFGKYKTIRCLKDDRHEDGCSVTLDQCMSCTRYEPVLGQIYEILDSTGMNGAFVTDDEQMSYSNAINFNSINQVSTKKRYADLEKESSNKYKSLIETWEEADRDKFIKSLKEKYSGEELDKKIKELKDHEYLFKMDWDLSYLETQEPDVKRYPLDGIKAKYKVKQEGEMSKEDFLRSFYSQENFTEEQIEEEIKKSLLKDKDSTVDKDLEDSREEDKEYDKDITNNEKLSAGEWVDTREESDSHQINKYTSEEFFFDGFGTNLSASSSDVTSNAFGKSSNEVRRLIVETANKIIKDHEDGLACYNTPSPRCLKYTDKDLSSNKIARPEINKVAPNLVTAYDCSSFVSCCYHSASLTEFTNGNTKTILSQVRAGGEMWEIDGEESYKNALPGDVILKGDGKDNNFNPTHAGIYIGDKKMAHASMRTKDGKKEILISDVSYGGKVAYFCRSKELIALDKTISEGSGQFIWPTKNNKVTSIFGATRGKSRKHAGIDINGSTPGKKGDKIYASDSGTVVMSGPEGTFGNLIKIDHGNGYESLYAHNDKLLVSKGDKVTKGQEISEMGNTGGGLSTGVHLHFEVRKNKVAFDPLTLFDKSQYTIISTGNI